MNRFHHSKLLKWIMAISALVAVKPFHFPSSLDFRMNPDLQDEFLAFRQTEWSESVIRASSGVNSTVNQEQQQPQQNNCSSPLEDWIVDHILKMGIDNFLTLSEMNIDFLPFVYKRYIDTYQEPEFFGIFGEDTDELIDRHEQGEQFWSKAGGSNDLQTDDILLLAMHGSDLQEMNKLLPSMELLYPFLNETERVQAARSVQNFIESLPFAYNNPLLTANAFAAKGHPFTPGVFIKDAIFVGDGILEYLQFENLGSEGPDFVHAHEMGHHMQFELGLADIGNGTPLSEETRRTELMADALGAYFLLHKEGGKLEEHKIREIYGSAFVVGDCDFERDGHHGTPEQRECAAIWGAKRAKSSSDDGTIVHPRQFGQDFDEELDLILTLDNEACGLTAETKNGDSGDLALETEETTVVTTTIVKTTKISRIGIKKTTTVVTTSTTVEDVDK